MHRAKMGYSIGALQETYEVKISFFVTSFCKDLKVPLLSNSRLGIDMSDKISADHPGGIRAVLSADNEPNGKVWDGIHLITNSKKDVQIKFLPASGFLNTLGLPEGEMLSDKALFKKDDRNGHLIGYRKIIGNLCKGEKATLQISFKNTGKTITKNVGFRVELSNGLSLVPGTTRLYNQSHPNGTPLKDCLHKNGALTGTYYPDSHAYILYTVEANSEFNGQELLSNAYLFYDEKGFASATTYLNKSNKNVIETNKRIQYDNGEIYVGEVKNGLPHGKGVLTTKGGLKYEGMFVNGKKNGRFLCKDKAGSRFENYEMGE